MERILTQDIGRRFKAGERRNYSRSTWDQLAASAGKPLDEISVTVDEVKNHGLRELSKSSGNIKNVGRKPNSR